MATKEETNWPEWFEKGVAAPFGAGVSHTFLLHGDVNGLTRDADYNSSDLANSGMGYLKLEAFLRKVFSERPLLMFYNLAAGLYFANDEQEELFRKTSGMDADGEDGAADSKADPAIAAAVLAAKKKAAKRKKIPTDPVSCFALVDRVFRRVKDAAMIIRSVHAIAPAGIGAGGSTPFEKITVEQLKSWAGSSTLRSSGTLIVMTTDSSAKVSAELLQGGGGVRTVTIRKPDDATRKEFLTLAVREPVVSKDKAKIEAQIKKLREKYLDETEEDKARVIRAEIQSLKLDLTGGRTDNRIVLPDGVTTDMLVRATQGMSLSQINEMLIMVRAEKSPVNLSAVKNKKREILNAEYGDLMELIEPEHSLEDIGGREHVKAYLENVFTAILQGKKNLVPQGTILMGPPGTGKTVLVEAAAKGADWPCVRLKNTRSMWVGESEAKQERLIQALWDLAPVIVFRDEADLSDASRDSYKGDSGVSERIMQSWMTFLSDSKIRGKVWVINCTNRPDRMDPALKRTGRSDDRIFIPTASEKERAEIFRVIFRHDKVPTKLTNFDEFAKRTAILSGADIQGVVLASQKFAFADGSDEVLAKHLHAAIDDFIPSASQKENDLMSLVCIVESSSRKMLPPNVNEIVRDIVARNLVPEIDKYLEQIRTRDIIDLATALRPPAANVATPPVSKKKAKVV